MMEKVMNIIANALLLATGLSNTDKGGFQTRSGKLNADLQEAGVENRTIRLRADRSDCHRACRAGNTSRSAG